MLGHSQTKRKTQKSVKIIANTIHQQQNSNKYDAKTRCLGRGIRLLKVLSSAPHFFHLTHRTTTLKQGDIILLDKTTTPSKIFYKEFVVRDGVIQPAEHPEACYSCHSSGVRQIVDVTHVPSSKYGENPGPIVNDKKSLQRLKEFNTVMKGYTLPDWHGSYQPEKWFPPIDGKSQSSFSCYSCHDGEERGVLTPLTNRAEMARKIFEEKSMPPRFKGSAEHAQAAWLELSKEKYKREVESRIKTIPRDSYDRESVMREFFSQDGQYEPNE